MSYKNVFGKEAVEKFKQLAESIDCCMFCTNLNNQPIATSPMSVQEVDELGNVWFLAHRMGEKGTNIKLDKSVQLFFGHPKDYTFMSVYGKADLVDDQARIDKYWNKMMEGWFEKGRQDPAITLIKVTPEEIRYWETKDNKIVTFAKVLWTAVTGNKTDIGHEGKIDV